MASSPNLQRQQLSLLGYWGGVTLSPAWDMSSPGQSQPWTQGGHVLLQVLLRKCVHTLLLSNSRNKARDN